MRGIRQLLRTKGTRGVRFAHHYGALRLLVFFEFGQLFAHQRDKGIQGRGKRSAAAHINPQIGGHRPGALQRHVNQPSRFQFSLEPSWVWKEIAPSFKVRFFISSSEPTSATTCILPAKRVRCGSSTV